MITLKDLTQTAPEKVPTLKFVQRQEMHKLSLLSMHFRYL